MRISWTVEQEYKVCDIAIKQFVIEKSSLSFDDYYSIVSMLPMTKNSIKMRLSNIRAILEELRVEHTIPVGTLVNYSKRNKEIIIDLLNKYNVKYYIK